MYALAVRFTFFDDAGCDLYTGDSGFGLFFILLQLFDHLVRNMNTGYIVIHELAHSC